MKLRFKLPFFTSVILFVMIVTVTFFSLNAFKREIEKGIKSYRKEATNQILNNLKDIVNIAYAMIDNSYQLSTPQSLKKKYGIEISDTTDSQDLRMLAMNIMKITLGNLRVLRYGTNGYIWINEFNPPYKVIMHPIKPELEGKSWVFYIGKTDKNVYEAFHDSIVAGHGAGRVSYNFYKPGTNEKIPKISWVRLYAPLGWVIGTGVYVDYIDKIVAQKQAELRAQIQSLIIAITTIGIFFIILSIILLTVFARTITTPLYRIEKQLDEMSKGKIVDKLDIHRKDEIGQMKKSLDKLIDALQMYADFAFEIGKENYEADFERLSDEDVLGTALLEMRDSLKKAREQEEERLREERMRQWVNEGVNRIGDIITISPNIQSLVENVLPRLVDYITATMGAFFLIEFDEDGKTFLELKSAVAYEKRKYRKKIFELDEGLIGSCFMEKEPIYMTDLPEDYIQVRTGLGTANPRNLYLVPLKFESVVYGVLELAAFKIFSEYDFKLIDEVAKLMAVSLSIKPKYAEWNQ